jgi:ornithine carbamoyltransferase
VTAGSRAMTDRGRDLLRIADLEPSEVMTLVSLADDLKSEPQRLRDALVGQTMVGVFELPSTRTRIAFAAAAQSLGMTPVVLSVAELQLSRGEGLDDTARAISALSAVAVLRLRSDETAKEFADLSTVPVVNGLTDMHHPCEAITMLVTIQRHFGRLSGIRVAYVGAGNNVCHSLLEGGAAVGLDLRVASPPGRQPSSEVVSRASETAMRTDGVVLITTNPREAVTGADVVCTDVWVSMADEETDVEPMPSDYRVDDRLLTAAAENAVFLHCLPARRGEEVSTDVIDGPRSLVWDNVANERPVAEAVLYWAVTGQPPSATKLPSRA